MKIKIEYHVETKKVRDTKCPIRMSIYDNKDFERCLSCAYFKDENCNTKEYFVKFIKDSETDDDKFGGMPSTDYWWKFPCSKCGKEIEKHSGMSSISNYEYIECEHCKTPHVLIKGGYIEGTFLIPDI